MSGVLYWLGCLMAAFFVFSVWLRLWLSLYLFSFADEVSECYYIYGNKSNGAEQRMELLD